MNRKKESKREKESIYLQILQWILLTASVGVAIAMLPAALFFPPALVPLALAAVTLNLARFPLGIRGLYIKKTLNRFLNTAQLLTGAGLLLTMIIAPPLAPAVGIVMAISTIGFEGIKAINTIRKSIGVIKNLYLSSTKDKSPQQIIELKRQRNTYAFKLAEQGFKIGLAATVIGLTVGSFFMPPLMFAAAGVGAIGGMGYLGYKYLIKPKLLEALDKPLKEEEKKIASKQSTQPTEPETPKMHKKLTIEQQPKNAQNPEEIKNIVAANSAPLAKAETPSIIKSPKTKLSRPQVLSALRRQSTANPVIYYNETFVGHDPEGAIFPNSALAKKIEQKAREIFGNEIKEIDIGMEVAIITFQPEQEKIMIHAKSMNTNSPDADTIQNMAKLAKALDWKTVRIGKTLNSELKEVAKTEATSVGMKIKEDETPATPVDSQKLKHY